MRHTTNGKTTPRRVNFVANQDDFAVLVYGSLGFSTKYIRELLGFTPCQVSYRLHAGEVKRADYRNGNNTFACYVTEQVKSNGKDFADLKRLIRQKVFAPKEKK